MTSVLILQGILADYRRPLFNALAKRYDVTVLHAGRAARTSSDMFEEIAVAERRLGPFHFPDHAKIAAAIAEHDVVIAMFDLAWPAYLLPLFRARSRRPFLVLHGHRYSGRWLADRARNFLMRRADVLLMYGTEHNDQMVAAGIDPARIVTAPNTIEVANHADTSDQPANSLLYVGRLQARKQLDMAIRIFARLQGRIDPALTLDIVGAGEPEAALREQAKALGVADKVKFHGANRDNDELKRFFSRAIAYFSPGPVGLGVLHAFAFGVPVLTLAEGYHGPEVHNIVDGENGMLSANESDLEAAVLRVCTEEGYAARLGRAAYRHYAQERTLDAMHAGFVTAIERASSEKQKVLA